MSTLHISTYLNRGASSKAPLGAAKVSAEAGWDSSWIEPENFEIDHFEDDEFDGEQYTQIIIELDKKTETLIDAYRAGKVLVFDGDFDVQITADEDGGNPELEIFWAVKYRGSLSVWSGFTVHGQHELDHVDTLEEAKEIVDAEWVQDAKPDSSGFINPWIEDADGNQVEYTPSQEEIDEWTRIEADRLD